MKLPEKKRDRNLLLAFIAVTALALLYLGRTIFWAPMQKARALDQVKQDELADKIAKAERELRLAAGFAGKYAEAQARFGNMVSNNLLRPILGSYQISLQERLTPVIRATGFQLAGITPIGNQPFPSRNGSDSVFACYMAEITGTGSFDTICRLVEAILAVSPCIHVSEITIQGQGKERPAAHRVSIRIEWPIQMQNKE